MTPQSYQARQSLTHAEQKYPKGTIIWNHQEEFYGVVEKVEYRLKGGTGRPRNMVYVRKGTFVEGNLVNIEKNARWYIAGHCSTNLNMLTKAERDKQQKKLEQDRIKSGYYLRQELELLERQQEETLTRIQEIKRELGEEDE